MRAVDRFVGNYRQLDTITLCRYANAEPQKLTSLEIELLERLEPLSKFGDVVEEYGDVESLEASLKIAGIAENYGLEDEVKASEACDALDFIGTVNTFKDDLVKIKTFLQKSRAQGAEDLADSLAVVLEEFDAKYSA